MTTRRRRDGIQRRNEILDAALRCFDRQGVLGTGIEAIRREAGASPSSVYNLFANVEEIMLALLVGIFDDLFAHIAARLGAAETAETSVRTLVDAHIEWIAAHPVEGRFMYQAMTLDHGGLGAEARARLAGAKERALMPILGHFGPFLARGELPPWPPTMLEVVMLGVAHEGLRRWLAGAEALNPEQLRQTLPGLAWRGLSEQAGQGWPHPGARPVETDTADDEP